MEAKRLMKVTYQDLKKGIRLNAYADAVIWSEDPSPTLAGLRFGGYAEVVRGLTDAIYGGATIEIEDADGSLLTLKSLSKQYHREVSHEGLYAEATLIAEDEIQESSKSQDEKSSKHAQKDDLFDDNVPQQDIPAHICYIFCHPGNEDELFQAIDQKSYVPMIPEYQDYVLAELKRRRILRPLRVRSLYQELEAWKLCCEAKDQNLVKVMEDGLKQGKIKIPGAAPGPSLLDGVHSVTDYLNTFGVAVAERIKKLFVPLFDPATEPLSEEVLDINEYIRAHAGYSLYDAQLAVAESIKRKLGQSKVALIVAGCGTGKTKIGSVAVAAAGLQSHQISAGHSKTFSIVLCPAHVTKKWVREIEESIPNTFAAVVRSISEFDLLYKLYEQGSRNCFAIISKEKARDGYRITTIPELKGIHMEADARLAMLTMTATNQEVSIRASMPAAVEESGSAVIPADLLPDILKRLPGDQVSFSTVGPGIIHIGSGYAEYRLNILDAAKYPLPEVPFLEDTIPVSGICSLARQTLFAAAAGDQQNILKTVRLKVGPYGLKATSSNGFCIAEAAGDKNCVAASETCILVPARSLSILAAISLDSDVYQMGLTREGLAFWNGTTMFCTHLIDGSYPDTDGLLDRIQGAYSASIEAAELYAAVDAVTSLASADKDSSGRGEIMFGEHEMVVSAETSDGRASVPVKALILSPSPYPFYYDFKQLMRYLKQLRGRITLEFDQNGLLVIRPGETRYLQSPMRAPKQAAGGKAA